MRTTSLLAIGLLVPAVALAVEISPATFYTDVRPTSADSVGINLLTRVGAVQGIAANRFAPSRPVNRAEFLKMAILSLPAQRQPTLAPSNCFPDVRSTDWFSPYICSAKTAGIVSGQADQSIPSDQWKFDPASTVQYDAALKMLTRLYAYEIPSVVSADWGTSYYDAAVVKGTDLPITINFATPLSRGKAARLIGAFLAESAGQLSQYRLAESGQYESTPAPSSASSISSSVPAPSSSSQSSISSISSIPSTLSLYTLPSVSHFLLVGKTSDAIADFLAPSRLEASQVSLVTVTLAKEARSLDHLELRTASGDLVAILKQRTTTDSVDYKLIYESSVTVPGTYVLPAGSASRLAVVAVIRTTDNNGFAEDLVQIRTIAATLRTVMTNQSSNLVLTGPFPKHQTSLGKIQSITAVSPVGSVLLSGTGVTLGKFMFSGSGIATRTPSLTELRFSLKRTGQVSLSSILLSSPATSIPCTLNNLGDTISCTGLSFAAGAFSLASPLTLTLSADITVPAGSAGNSLQAVLHDAGSPESLGSVQWSDGVGQYRWIEGPSPIAAGTDLRQQ